MEFTAIPIRLNFLKNQTLRSYFKRVLKRDCAESVVLHEIIMGMVMSGDRVEIKDAKHAAPNLSVLGRLRLDGPEVKVSLDCRGDNCLNDK